VFPVSAASGRYRLRSTGSAAYVLPRTRTKFGERGLFYSGSAAWNTLPSDLHDITDTSTFWKRLKHVLFDRAYNWLLLALLYESYSGALQISRLLIDWSPTSMTGQTLSGVRQRTGDHSMSYVAFFQCWAASCLLYILLIIPALPTRAGRSRHCLSDCLTR